MSDEPIGEKDEDQAAVECWAQSDPILEAWVRANPNVPLVLAIKETLRSLNGPCSDRAEMGKRLENLGADAKRAAGAGIITDEEDLVDARLGEFTTDLDRMARTIRHLWRERDVLRAMVDTEIERVAELCRGEVDAVFIKTPHAVVTGTIERISKRLHEKLGEDTLVILLEGYAEVEAFNEDEMRELGWVRSGRSEHDVFVCPECKVEHSRGPLDPLSKVYRCLGCGYSGPKVEAEKKKETPPIPPEVRDELDDDVEIYGNAFALFSRGEWRRLDPTKVKLDSRGGGGFKDGGGSGFVPAESSESLSPSIAEYPREVVCEGCGNVVAFGLPTVQDDSSIIAANLIRPNGRQPRDCDPLCLNCGESSMGIFHLTGGGPFSVRDRCRKCLHCGGRGRLAALADHDAMVPPCPCCKGTGEIPKEDPNDATTDEP